MKGLEKLLHLNLWFHMEVPATEQLVVWNAVVNGAKYVNMLQKLVLLLALL